MGNACCNGSTEDELFESNFSVGSKASSSEVLCKRRDGSSNGAEERLDNLKRKGRPPSDGLKNSEDKKGVVRVKIVLTKQELAQLLMTSKSNTAEAEILSEILKSLQRNESNESKDKGSEDLFAGFLREPWKPTLASIPEEC